LQLCSSTAIFGASQLEETPVKALILIASPRRNGNSAALATAAGEGLVRSKHQVEIVHADDYISGFLRDCRECRDRGGECSIGDKFRALFFDHFLPSDGLIVATPLYWYGMSGQLKAFFDRMFCYTATSFAGSRLVKDRMKGKRIGLLISSEETFPSASLGVVHQMQEFCRYTQSTLVNVVRGHGNSRGDVSNDPKRPIERARELGDQLFDMHTSDYTLETKRASRMWVNL
jgi:multimeric flavodoxin WrbA